METQEKQYQIIRPEIPRTLIRVPHQGKILTFPYEKYGPDTYVNVGNSIEQAGLKKPTMAETTSFVHPAFTTKKEEPEFKEIKKIMKNNLLLAFTRIDYRPNTGAFVYDEDDKEEFQALSTRGLESILGTKEENGAVYSKDRRLWLAPFGYEIKEMESYELAKNSFVTALNKGGKGAEKLAEVADKFKSKPYLWSFKSIDEKTVRVSALYSSWLLDRRLVVFGYDLGDLRDGCAFGISGAEGAKNLEPLRIHEESLLPESPKINLPKTY